MLAREDIMGGFGGSDPPAHLRSHVHPVISNLYRTPHVELIKLTFRPEMITLTTNSVATQNHHPEIQTSSGPPGAGTIRKRGVSHASIIP